MPIKYIPYFPSTVEGQAILNNFVRTRRALQYRDNDKVLTKIKRGMPYYEVEKIESVGNNPKNMLIRGECISACAYLKEKGIKIDLVYIDPPFASGADYAKKIYIRKNPKVSEAIKKAEEEMEIDDLKAFEEKMYGDIWNKEAYLNWMYENLVAIKSVMSETASIYVHLDWHIGHYVKILLDEIFGEDSFRNEIIWQKLKAAKGQATSFGNVHDMIYSYSKSNLDYIHNKQYVPHSEKRKKQHYNNYDQKLKKYYSLDSFTQSGRGEARNFGEYGILEPPPGKHWIWSQENIDKGLINRLIVFTSKGKPRVKRYLEDSSGIAIGDIWTDINPINSQADEDIDYSTQKPELLLERIINTSSNEFRNEKTKERMIVADFFGGSGVTAKKAKDLGRNFIHCDVGINSIQTTRDRLISAKTDFDILEIKNGVNLFRNPVQTLDKLKKMILGLRNEDKLDKFWEGAIQDSKLGTIPIYLPNLLDHTTKVLDIPLMNRIINEAIPDLPENIKKVIVYYIDIDDKKELVKFIREQNTLIEIELRDLKEILDDVVVDDIVEYTVKEIDGKYEIKITKFISDRLHQKIDEYNQKGLMQPLIQTEEENGNGKNGNGEEDNGKSERSGDPDSVSVSGKKKKFSPIEISKDGLELIEFISLDCKNKEGSFWHSDKEIKIDKLGYIIKDGKKTKTFWNAKIICNKNPLRIKVRNIAGDEIIMPIGESEKKKTEKEKKKGKTK